VVVDDEDRPGQRRHQAIASILAVRQSALQATRAEVGEAPDYRSRPSAASPADR
jgi:hypothetical protein